METEVKTTTDGVTVIEQRSFAEKIWSKHKKPIMIVGGVLIGLYAWKTLKKKK